MLGILDGLRTGGVDLGEADLIVGTSAGALAGAPLAGGMLDRAVAIYQRSQVPFFGLRLTTAGRALSALPPRGHVSQVDRLSLWRVSPHRST